jgi:glutathione S-transferase
MDRPNAPGAAPATAPPTAASAAPGGWVGIEQARALPGLRLVLLRGLPSPWSLAARAIFELKRVPFAKVFRAPTDAPEALREWTGQTSYPAAMYEDERPRTGWAEILLLAERLGPEPPLLPDDPEERAQVFGVAHEICGEMGLAWCRRLMGIEARREQAPDDPQVEIFARKYGSGEEGFAAARPRLLEVLRMLGERLQAQREAGRAYLVGSALSAADLYWATFSNMVALLPPEKLPLPDPVRAAFATNDPEIARAVTPALLRHRDWIIDRYLRPPIEL